MSVADWLVVLLGACILVMGVALVALIRALAAHSDRVAELMKFSHQHALAWSEDQRLFMRLQHEQDRAELLLREARAKAAAGGAVPVPRTSNQDDIVVDFKG